METRAETALERDEQGRILPGASGNPSGRPARRDFAKLLQAAERVGAEVAVLVPPRAVRPSRRRDHDLPPAFASRGILALQCFGLRVEYLFDIYYWSDGKAS